MTLFNKAPINLRYKKTDIGLSVFKYAIYEAKKRC